MKKFLMLLSVLGIVQSCNSTNRLRILPAGEILGSGYRKREAFEEELKGTGYDADLNCTKDSQGREWCKAEKYHKKR